MQELHPHQTHLLSCISLELKEQEKRYKIDPKSGLKKLRALGVLLHPINVTRKSFGYADYPEVAFRLSFLNDTSSFKDNSAIECFIDGEDSIKGVLLGLDGKKGMVRLFSPDFPDWIEESGVGIKLSPDQHTIDQMNLAVKEVDSKPWIKKLFSSIHGKEKFGKKSFQNSSLDFKNTHLNSSQKNAVSAIYDNQDLLVVHGPPGTGKTTTLIEAVVQKIKSGDRILMTAPSNAAVDNFARGLIDAGVKILRVGNTLKVDAAIFPFTSIGRMQNSTEQKNIKRLKIQAEEFRKMALQYKRSFGKAEREQRSLLFREMKKIRKEIRDIRDHFDGKLYEKADVILGTPIGLKNFLPKDAIFDTLFFDEGGQCVEPLAWLIFPFAKTWVLAGDPFQLPPTVLSAEAVKKGFNVSILEKAFDKCENVHFLDTQYRMRKSIADFSSRYFYNNELQTPENQNDIGQHAVFYDTAGTGFEERSGKDGASLINEGELDLVHKIIDANKFIDNELAVISPYSGQVQQAKELLSANVRISTVDSFQGQEKKIVIISLVRSNSDAIIGFLKDYRRMNVAMTRAKEHLIVIGDSSTIGQDKFFSQFLEYMEEINGYKSAWELMG